MEKVSCIHSFNEKHRIIKRYYLKHFKSGKHSRSSPQLVNKILHILAHFSVSVVLVRYTMTTISINYSETAKYYSKLLQNSRSAAEKLFCIFMRHKITYGASSNVCKIQLLLGNMQYLRDCLFLFYYCTFKFQQPNTKKMHAVSSGKARIN